MGVEEGYLFHFRDSFPLWSDGYSQFLNKNVTFSSLGAHQADL